MDYESANVLCTSVLTLFPSRTHEFRGAIHDKRSCSRLNIQSEVSMALELSHENLESANAKTGFSSCKVLSKYHGDRVSLLKTFSYLWKIVANIATELKK
ncbi:hypothetical protein MPTK1_3g14240 [Marchantia polymorpha subsp. ruderalis]|uniref:Uncharacterized protein n=2 Tax=Marchantia polymorpha TaxID=3197 RepID=A0AAF6B0N4_MARPO|nr:hypothetical protein MARPO_0004s0247 [Marchantia polymorpha]BBN05568.1 hypothetical protein Mp_3g14240 [Marchantia polymorpha subsp. ruderalis]|eukprot:PTQ49014.1 hypothetical protein MARPO_0004s0247 [Marchantia polymorpha]